MRRDTINKMKSQSLNEKRYLQAIYPIKGLYLKYTRNSYNVTSKKKKKKPDLKIGRHLKTCFCLLSY